MYGIISIATAEKQAQIKTNAHDSIYGFLIDCGYGHEESAEVADWAEVASIGEEYELSGAKIIIIG